MSLAIRVMTNHHFSTAGKNAYTSKNMTHDVLQQCLVFCNEVIDYHITATGNVSPCSCVIKVAVQRKLEETQITSENK